MINKVAVKKFFIIEDQQWVLVHLQSFDWDFTRYGPVFLCFGDFRLKMSYIASGNVDGDPVLRLIPMDPRFQTVKEVAAILSEHSADVISLERE